MKTLGILGSGYLGQQIAHYALTDCHYNKVVFLDDFTSLKEVKGIPIVGKISNTLNLFQRGVFDEIIIAIGYKHLEKRKEFYQLYSDKVSFGTIIHSTAWLDPTAVVKKGSVIYPNSSLDYNTIINENTIVNNGCTISHDSIIGSHCFLSPRVAIAGFVNISEQCIIGINATVIDNVFINKKTQIGAGTVVIKNISQNGLYVGNPQRFIR